MARSWVRLPAGLALVALILALGLSWARPALAEATAGTAPAAASPVAVASDDGAASAALDPEHQPLQFRDYEDPATAGGASQPLWQAASWFVVKLLFVLGLIYVSLSLYKRFMGVPGQRPVGSRIRVVESSRLAGTQTLHLVEAGDRTLLVGSNGTDLLVKLHEWPTDADFPDHAERAFGQSLKEAAGRQDDFEGVVESSLRQVIIPGESPGA